MNFNFHSFRSWWTRSTLVLASTLFLSIQYMPAGMIEHVRGGCSLCGLAAPSNVNVSVFYQHWFPPWIPAIDTWIYHVNCEALVRGLHTGQCSRKKMRKLYRPCSYFKQSSVLQIYISKIVLVLKFYLLSLRRCKVKSLTYFAASVEKCFSCFAAPLRCTVCFIVIIYLSLL